MPLTIIINIDNSPFSVPILVSDISTQQETKTSIHSLPGANKDLVQKMGMSNRRFTIEGVALTQSALNFLILCNNQTGSIYFSGARGTNSMSSVVMFSGLNYVDSGRRPEERKFVLSAVEIL